MNQRTLANMEKELLKKVLAKTRGDLDKAARLLQITHKQLKQKIKSHGLDKP